MVKYTIIYIWVIYISLVDVEERGAVERPALDQVQEGLLSFLYTHT